MGVAVISCGISGGANHCPALVQQTLLEARFAVGLGGEPAVRGRCLSHIIHMERESVVRHGQRLSKGHHSREQGHTSLHERARRANESGTPALARCQESNEVLTSVRTTRS